MQQGNIKTVKSETVLSVIRPPSRKDVCPHVYLNLIFCFSPQNFFFFSRPLLDNLSNVLAKFQYQLWREQLQCCNSTNKHSATLPAKETALQEVKTCLTYPLFVSQPPTTDSDPRTCAAPTSWTTADGYRGTSAFIACY